MGYKVYKWRLTTDLSRHFIKNSQLSPIIQRFIPSPLKTFQVDQCSEVQFVVQIGEKSFCLRKPNSLRPVIDLQHLRLLDEQLPSGQ